METFMTAFYANPYVDFAYHVLNVLFMLFFVYILDKIYASSGDTIKDEKASVLTLCAFFMGVFFLTHTSIDHATISAPLGFLVLIMYCKLRIIERAKTKELSQE